MNPLDNPFAPGAGVPPPELAGRNQLLESIHAADHGADGPRAALGRPGAAAPCHIPVRLHAEEGGRPVSVQGMS